LDAQYLRVGLTQETFSELVNRTMTKLQSWKTRNVSKAGRMTLV